MEDSFCNRVSLRWSDWLVCKKIFGDLLMHLDTQNVLCGEFVLYNSSAKESLDDGVLGSSANRYWWICYAFRHSKCLV